MQKIYMDYNLNMLSVNYDIYNVKKKYIIFLIALLGIFLNQSKVLFGTNLSIADIICLIIIIFLFINKRLIIPLIPILFFLLLLIITLFTSTVYVSILFEYYPKSTDLVVNYLKLIAIFSFFIAGFNIAKLNFIKLVINWYANAAVLVGIMGIISALLNLDFINSIFYENNRFLGLMNDPNYFSIIQISALAYFIRQINIKKYIKYFIILLLIVSVLLSGSKTGFLTLICYFFLLFLEYIWKRIKHFSFLYFFVFGVLPILIILLIFLILDINIYINIIQLLESIIPAFQRLTPLLTGKLNQSISMGGSKRDLVWETALKMIELSPIFGVGIGTYKDIAYKLSNYGSYAHNTFLQLYAEWGIPLATLFFMSNIFLLGKITIMKEKKQLDLILRDILVIFLIGSLGISLNNARMFWLYLGALIYNLQYNSNKLFYEK